MDGNCDGPQQRMPEPGSLPYFISLYVFPIWFLIGTCGNLTTLIILKKFKQKSKAFLSAMALCDFLFFFPMLIYSFNAYDSLVDMEDFMYFSYHAVTPLVALANWFATASNWFIVWISIERLMAIRNPLTVSIIWKRNLAKVLIALILILSALIQTPRFFGYEIMSDVFENKTVYCYIVEDVKQMDVLMIKFTNFVLPFISIIIPLLMLAILNGFIVYYIRKNRRATKDLCIVNMNRQMLKERKVTQLVMAIVGTFFVFHIPSAIVSFMLTTVNDNEVLSQLTGLPVQITNNLEVCSRFVNFFLYFCCSSKFRKQFKMLWRMCFKTTYKPLLSSRTSSTFLISLHRFSKS